MPAERPKPITDEKIPGTDVPDVARAPAESDHHRQWMSRVAVSTAVMAALAAVSTMFSGSHLNQAMIEQIREADQWSLYQAKGIKYAVLEGRVEAAAANQSQANPADTARLARYKDEQADIARDAETHKAAVTTHLFQYRWMSRAATALQVGIALAAVALLLRRNIYWALALLAGAAGTGLIAYAFLA